MQNALNTPRRGRPPLSQARKTASNAINTDLVGVSHAARDVITSNETTNHFLGTSRRSWMTIPGAAIQSSSSFPGQNQNVPQESTSIPFTTALDHVLKTVPNVSQTGLTPPTPIMASTDKPILSYHCVPHTPSTPPEEPRVPSTEQEKEQDTWDGQASLTCAEEDQRWLDNNASMQQAVTAQQPETEVVDLTASLGTDVGTDVGTVNSITSQIGSVAPHEAEVIDDLSPSIPTPDTSAPDQADGQGLTQNLFTAPDTPAASLEQSTAMARNAVQTTDQNTVPQLQPESIAMYRSALQNLRNPIQDPIDQQRTSMTPCNTASPFAMPQDAPYHPIVNDSRPNPSQVLQAESMRGNCAPSLMLVNRQQGVPVSATSPTSPTTLNMAVGYGVQRPLLAPHLVSNQLPSPITSSLGQLNARKRSLPIDPTVQASHSQLMIEQPTRIQGVPQAASARPNRAIQSSHAVTGASFVVGTSIVQSNSKTTMTSNRSASYLTTFESTVADMWPRIAPFQIVKRRISCIKRACQRNDTLFLLIHEVSCL